MTIIVQVSSTATTSPYSPDILNWVCPDVPMAPLPMVNNAIRDSVIELCERGLIWRTELQQILVLGDTATVTMAASAQYATSVTVSSITNFNDLDTITVDLTDGTKWRGHVSGTPSGSTINLDGALNQAVEIGAAVTKLVYLYPITLPANTAFVKGISAWLNDAPLEPISPDDLDTEFNNSTFKWVGTNWRTDVRLPTRWYMQDDATVGLAMPPDTNGALRILAAIKPTRASATFPQRFFERYIEGIAHGAKARLMMVPTKAYTNLKLGEWHRGQFDACISDAKVYAARGMTRAPLRSHTVFGLR